MLDAFRVCERIDLSCDRMGTRGRYGAYIVLRRDCYSLCGRHGAGWAIGDIDIDDNQLRTLCVDLQAVVVNVEYR